MLIHVMLRFGRGYIAHPYWPEREKLINAQKESGVNRARTAKSRDAALRAYLDAKGMTPDDYRALEARAARPFYTCADVGDVGEEIVVPAHQLHGMMAQACDLAPAALRIASTEQVRSILTWGDLRTGRSKPDGVWERYVAPKKEGRSLSNQRSLRSDPYLGAGTEATGTLRVLHDEAEAKSRRLIVWAGEEIGVGAARKMGWGRFQVIDWDGSDSQPG